MMVSESLRSAILAIPGIVGADFDGENDVPAGVRVQLATGADATSVSERVKRVLADHGMKPQMGDGARSQGEPVSAPPPPPGYENSPSVEQGPLVADADIVPTTQSLQVSVPGGSYGRSTPTQGPAPISARTLDLVGVQETALSTSTVATVDGRTAARVVDGRGLDAAIAEAVLDAAGYDDLSIRSVQRHSDVGSIVVTVLVEDAGGKRAVGSAVGEVGSVYAVGRATMRAGDAATGARE